jgi:AraC-like DNA-binding protein
VITINLTNLARQGNIGFNSKIFRVVAFNDKYFYPSHEHKSIEINYITRGSCIMQFDNDVVKFSENNYMVIFPGVKHHFFVDNSRGVKLVQLEFEISNLNPRLFQEFPDKELSFVYNLLTNSSRYIKMPRNDLIKDCIKRIIHEESLQSMYSNDLIELYYKELIFILSREINLTLDLKGATANIQLKNILGAINENIYNPDLSVKEIARYCGFSDRYLRKLFDEHLKMVPVTYINNLRINKAKEELISSSSDSIKEIGYKVGYSSPQYFSKIFKKITGFTPVQFKDHYFRNEQSFADPGSKY